jgi:hypothetical protein
MRCWSARHGHLRLIAAELQLATIRTSVASQFATVLASRRRPRSPDHGRKDAGRRREPSHRRRGRSRRWRRWRRSSRGPRRSSSRVERSRGSAGSSLGKKAADKSDSPDKKNASSGVRKGRQTRRAVARRERRRMGSVDATTQTAKFLIDAFHHGLNPCSPARRLLQSAVRAGRLRLRMQRAMLGPSRFHP